MATIGVRELKARLSAYVRTVRAGEVVVVTDHGDIVAELRRPMNPRAADGRQRRYQEAVAAGWLHTPSDSANRSWLDGTGARLPRGTSAELLDAERGDE
jgi:antitoxin (DNA-binding transcriptional repressor) of toxin-antitoxin stability system